MNLKDAHYRKAVNNKKCALCGYRTIRILRNGSGVEAGRIITCIMFGDIIEDDHTCDYWKFE